MSSKIEAKEIPIGDLFSPKFIFKIPIYQRPLSWSRENFKQLIEDLSTACNGGGDYFLGSILIQESGESEKNVYDLIDGQQRLTSLAILLATIRDMGTDSTFKQNIYGYLFQAPDKLKKIPEVMRITPWEDLILIFKQYIYEKGGTQKYIESFGKTIIVDEDDPRYHLYEAIDQFQQTLSTVDLEKLTIYLLNNVFMVYIKTGNQVSAFRLFNVINSRGIPLTTADLLKSENLQQVVAADRPTYAKKWLALENDLGREELENVIGHIRTMILMVKPEANTYEEYNKKIFGYGKLNRGAVFIDYLNAVGREYSEKVLDGHLSTGDASTVAEYKVTMELMRRFIPFSDWIPPFLSYLHKFGEERLLDFVRQLERKTIVEWGINLSGTERMTSLNKIIQLVNEKEKVNDVLESMEKGDWSKSGLLFKSQLNEYGFYKLHGGRFARYILLRLNQEMIESENFGGYPGTITVEHILPQKPPHDSEWVKTFTEEQREKHTNQLGNLVLLSGAKNSQAQNYDFKTKKEKYFNPKSTAFFITQQLKDIESWTLDILEKRHSSLVEKAYSLYFPITMQQ